MLHKDEIAEILPARRNRPLILIDIAVPRDIAADVEELENVYLYNIDHLKTIVRENSRMREQELSKCNEIIARRAAALMAKIRTGSGEAARPGSGTAAGLVFRRRDRLPKLNHDEQFDIESKITPPNL